MGETVPLPVLHHALGWVGTSRSQHWLCTQKENASHSTGTGREGEVCQLSARVHPLLAAAAEGGAGDEPLVPQAGLPNQGGKEQTTMQAKFRRGGQIWPQKCSCSSRTAAWDWGRAFPLWSY